VKTYKASAPGIIQYLIGIGGFGGFIILRFSVGQAFDSFLPISMSICILPGVAALLVLFLFIRLLTLLIYHISLNDDRILIRRRDMKHINFDKDNIVAVSRVRGVGWAVTFRYGEQEDIVEIPFELTDCEELIGELSEGIGTKTLDYNPYTEKWLKRPRRK
jgi:hypothetical protein